MGDQTVTEVDVNSTMLDVEATFCYLGDMLRSSWGCDSAIAARCCVAWGKFRKLLPVLTSRHLSPRVCDKVTWPAFARLCSMLVKHGDRRNPSCGSFAATPESVVTLSQLGGLCASKIPEAMPAGVLTPGRFNHAGQALR